MMLAYHRDPRYLYFYPWTNRTEAQVRDFVEMFVQQQAEQPRRKFQFAITFPNDDRVIGNCGIRCKPENNWEADIGYEMAPEHWSRGYATEAALAMVNFGFQTLKLHRISAWCIAANTASARVLEKVGMQWRDGCEKMSISRGAGGIPCFTAYLRVSGGLCPQIVDWNTPHSSTFLEERCLKKERF
jgi:[ribosomal protein S5]-alanine N-acetyltransferase